MTLAPDQQTRADALAAAAHALVQTQPSCDQIMHAAAWILRSPAGSEELAMSEDEQCAMVHRT